ncbi:DUF4166 domain-containing protein [Leifsonia kafniensis]|uniref:DUF4166 domain-containing protein n=1 Tax=Leifsonia kafniensis TaxID=475957 RepID=A0ABP7K684_9MICO
MSGDPQQPGPQQPHPQHPGPQHPVPTERQSPYETIWRGLPDTLHPRLRDYCGVIPPGHHGSGHGSFDRVGTPRRWLWPLLWLFGRPDVLFPGWYQGVPFTVINRPTRSPRGAPAVAASRTFQFTTGDRTMIDAITAEPAPIGLVDYLGARRRLRATLRARVVDGAMHLDSTAVALRIGRRWLTLPHRLSPRVALIERFDDAEAVQRVPLTLTAPLIGTVYEYAGAFSYEIREGDGSE